MRVHADAAILSGRGSTNVTHFNGRRVHTARLQPGYRFIIGNTTLTFTVEADG